MKDLKTSKPSTAIGLFHSRSEAERAVSELKRAGFPDDQISLVGKNEEGEVQSESNNMAGTGAATGMAVGAGTAALVSLGISFGVIPVIGPILAMGPLAAALVSAAGGLAAGGLLGALAGLGIPEHEAKYYEGEVQSGRFLVTVKAESRYDEAWAIMQRLGAYNHDTATAAPMSATTAGAVAGEQTMKLHEEKLNARKESVSAGEVRVRKEVITEHKTLDVPLEREEIVIDRRPVAGQVVSSAEMRAGEEVRIPVREEQVRLEKTQVVKEEVTVGKRKVQETEHVDGTVRKEELRVEKEGDVDVRGSGAPKDAKANKNKGR